jgi:hypothetical protein
VNAVEEEAAIADRMYAKGKWAPYDWSKQPVYGEFELMRRGDADDPLPGDSVPSSPELAPQLPPDLPEDDDTWRQDVDEADPFAFGEMMDATDEQKIWAETCTFFGHDATKILEGVTLPGMNTPLRPYQMFGIFQELGCLNSPDWLGQFNALKQGLGKTMMSIGLLACIVLAYTANDRKETDNPAMHRNNDNTGECTVQYRYGIQCPCDKKSLTYAIVKKTRRSFAFIATKASLREQWNSEFLKFCTPTVVNSQAEELMPSPLFETVVYHVGKFTMGKLCTPGLQLEKEHFSPKVTFPEGKLFPPPAQFHRDYWRKLHEYKEVDVRGPQKESRKAYPKVMEGRNGMGSNKYDIIYTCTLSELEVFLQDRVDGIPGLQVSRELGNPKKGVKPERMVFICSRNTMANSGGSYDAIHSNTFEIAFQVPGNKHPTTRHFRVTHMMRPTTFIYDEFHEAKGKDSKTVLQIEEVTGAKLYKQFPQRSLVLMLSGTPVEHNVRKDLGSAMTLLRSTPIDKKLIELKSIMDTINSFHEPDIQEARQKTAYQRSQDEANTKLSQFYKNHIKGQTNVQIEKKIKQLEDEKNALFVDIFKGGWFSMGYSKRFLGEPLPITRPNLEQHLASSPPLPANLQAKIDEQMNIVRKKLEELKAENKRSKKSQKSSAKGKDKASNKDIETRLQESTEFNIAFKCAILPSLFSLAEAMGLSVNQFCSSDYFKGTKEARTEKVKLIAKHIDSAKCQQLTELYDIVSKKCANRAGLIVCHAPLVAHIVHLWIQKQPKVKSLLISAQTTPKDRPGTIANFKKIIQRDRGETDDDELDEAAKKKKMEKAKEKREEYHYVIVSTYTIIGTGLDGLQTFADYIVSFGSPFLSRDIEQALSRVHRPGSKFKNVDAFAIHGHVGSLDWQYSLKIQRRRGELPIDSILNMALLAKSGPDHAEVIEEEEEEERDEQQSNVVSLLNEEEEDDDDDDDA